MLKGRLNQVFNILATMAKSEMGIQEIRKIIIHHAPSAAFITRPHLKYDQADGSFKSAVFTSFMAVIGLIVLGGCAQVTGFLNFAEVPLVENGEGDMSGMGKLNNVIDRKMNNYPNYS